MGTTHLRSPIEIHGLGDRTNVQTVPALNSFQFGRGQKTFLNPEFLQTNPPWLAKSYQFRCYFLWWEKTFQTTFSTTSVLHFLFCGKLSGNN